jgi:hypothetical protein
MHRKLARTAIVLACLSLPVLATAQMAQRQPQQPHQQNGIDYINGGVGQDEQNAMRALKADYNLQLTFATKESGAFRSDVQLDIMDAKGASLLSVPNTGPMFFAKLTPGTYRFSAAAEGKVFKRTVKIGNAPREMTLHWENDSPDDPGPQD